MNISLEKKSPKQKIKELERELDKIPRFKFLKRERLKRSLEFYRSIIRIDKHRKR